MTLEQQICSLELAKRLKELGVKQESYFNWAKIKQEPKTSWIIDKNAVTLPEVDYYSAFTVAEIAAILPYKIMLGEEKCYLMIEKDQNNNDIDHWRVLYTTIEGERRCHEANDFLANALAVMLIHLLENKLITL